MSSLKSQPVGGNPLWIKASLLREIKSRGNLPFRGSINADPLSEQARRRSTGKYEQDKKLLVIDYGGISNILINSQRYKWSSKLSCGNELYDVVSY